MTGPEFPTIETRRLVLRLWEFSDAPAIYGYRSDPEIYRYMRPEPPASPDVVAESIRRWSELRAEDRTPMWVIALKEEGVVGLIGFTRLDRANSSAYLTYEVARQHWGKGIVTEAVRAVLGYGFGTLGLNRIAAYCWKGNMASRRVMGEERDTSPISSPKRVKEHAARSREFPVTSPQFAGAGAEPTPS